MLISYPFALAPHPIMPSVFPLQVYERIIELAADEPHFLWLPAVRDSFSFVCWAWRPKCRAVLFRTLRLDTDGVRKMIRFRDFFHHSPHLAILVEEVQMRLGMPIWSATMETFPYILAKHLPRLRQVSIGAQNNPIYMHHYFSFPSRRLQIDTVAILELSRVTFDKTFSLNWIASFFPQLRLLDIWWYAWANNPRFHNIPPIVELQLAMSGQEVVC